MHQQRLAIVIAAAVGMLGTFLPWVSVPFLGSISGARGDGWISFVLFLVALLMALLGNKQSIMKGIQFVVAIVFGALAAALGVWKILDINSAMGETTAENPLSQSLGSIVSIGIGLYVIVVAGIAIILLGFILQKEKAAPPQA
jgi:hypothetical protein